MLRLALTRFALFLPLALAAGCGSGGGSTVTGQVSFGSTKPAAGERWSLVMSDGNAKSYSAEVDPEGKFKFENVAAGSYTVNVTHYAAGGEAKGGKAKGPGAPPVTVPYPEKWTVPGGPFTLDVSKLPLNKKK